MGFICQKASGNAFSKASFSKPVILQPCQPSSDFCTSRSSTEVLWRPPGMCQLWVSVLILASGCLVTPPSFIYNNLESQSIQSCFSGYFSTLADK